MSDDIRYAGVGISGTHIWEADKGRIQLQIARNTIVRCQLTYGSPEPRPAISAALGIVLMIPGLIALSQILIFLQKDELLPRLRYEAALLVIGGIGVWLVVQALFRRRFFLHVGTGDAATKVIFGREARLNEIRNFLARARENFGAQIEDAVLHHL